MNTLNYIPPKANCKKILLVKEEATRKFKKNFVREYQMQWVTIRLYVSANAEKKDLKKETQQTFPVASLHFGLESAGPLLVQLPSMLTWFSYYINKIKSLFAASHLQLSLFVMQWRTQASSENKRFAGQASHTVYNMWYYSVIKIKRSTFQHAKSVALDPPLTPTQKAVTKNIFREKWCFLPSLPSFLSFSSLLFPCLQVAPHIQLRDLEECC